MVKQTIKAAVALPSNAAIKALSPDTAAPSVFAPADITPTLYLAKILEGISYNKGLLDDILYEVNYQDAGQVIVPETGTFTQVFLSRSGDGEITVNSARLLAEVITGTSYFQQMPPMRVNSDNLTPKARLALWIGWALNRDAKYWADGDQQHDRYVHYDTSPAGKRFGLRSEGSYPSEATSEQLDWEPVRNDLLQLKVPPGLFTATLRTHDERFGVTAETGLYMWGFMSWAASKSALDLLLDDTVRTKDTMTVQAVYTRKARKTLSPKDAHPAQWIELPE
jgi:hypothetical protein